MTQLDRDRALSKAKIQLMTRPDSAFYTTVCFSLRHIWDDDCPTAYTDGQVIGFNTKFFMDLSVEEQIFLLLHETLHVAYMHMGRLLGRDMRRWNIACDYVINLQLVDRGFKMPKGGLLDRAYAGMSADQVYDLLPKHPPEECNMDIRPSPIGDEELTQQVQDILVRAAIQSKMANDKPGSIPADIQLFLNGLLDPKLPWHRLLLKYLQAFAKNDYSFRKPNRRFFPKYHLPSLHGEKLMDLAVAVDISGSVSDSDFHTFISEIASILRMMKPEKITLLQFDTEIKSIDEVHNIQELMAVKFTGRGGTLIEPVLAWADKAKPQLLLVFSDGEFRFHGPETKSTTLWLVHNNPRFSPPFGKVIHYAI